VAGVFANLSSQTAGKVSTDGVVEFPGAVLIAALMLYPKLGKEFLPAFNEGSATISLVSAPWSDSCPC